jgi:hypothetical protein
LNKFYCNILTAIGFDGAQLKKAAPTRKTFVVVTKAHCKERILAIRKASTTGQMFFATGGRHLNADEFFQADTLKSRNAEIKIMEDNKKKRKDYCNCQQQAILLICKKGDLTWSNHKNFKVEEVRILLKWKKVVTKKTKKEDLVDLYIKADKPGITKAWTLTKEAALENLKDPQMDLKETALGVATWQMTWAICNYLATLDSPQCAALKQSLQDYKESKGKNVLY